jgi:hypothetical protein
MTIADHVRNHLKRHVRFSSDHDAIVVALWILHTHTLEAALSSPYLCVTSPVHGSGKSTLLSVLADLVPNPVASAHTTVAALFRSADGNTILLDEVDTMLKNPAIARDLIGVLNAGYSRGKAAVVSRCTGDNHIPTAFPVFGPKVIAGIDLPAQVPAATMSRSIEIRLERAVSSDDITPYGGAATTDASASLHADLLTWATEHLSVIEKSTQKAPDSPDLRWSQIWKPLFAVADALGETWLGSATAAFTGLVPEPEDDSMETVRLELLRDLCLAFHKIGADNISTEDLLHFLTYNLPDSRWVYWSRRRVDKRLDARDLAEILRPFGIKSKTVRLQGVLKQTAKGYRYQDLEPHWERYLGSAEPEANDEVIYERHDNPEPDENNPDLSARRAGHVGAGPDDDEDVPS